MKKRITFIALCFIAIAVTAQTAHIEVCYVAHHPNLTDGKTDLTNKYILLAKLLQKSEMRKDIVIELSYKGFS